MYYKHKTLRDVNNLKFSVWDREAEYGHALFVGNLVEISHFLENHNIKNLEVSALDLLSMQSYEPVAAEQWLDWYYSSALSALKENYFNIAVSESQIQQSIKTFSNTDFFDVVTVGLN